MNEPDRLHRSALRLPLALAGQRIGLFGGSFDPPHQGHLMLSRMAIRRLKLDAVWWLVTPGNPLKQRVPGALARRIAAAERIARDPRIIVTAVEAALATRYTADTLALIARRLPGVDLVWLMGADNLCQFHLWRNWRQIAGTMPIAVYDRPGSTFRAMASPAARALASYRIDEADAARLPGHATPAWTFLHGPRVDLSSTALRASSIKELASESAKS